MDPSSLFSRWCDTRADLSVRTGYAHAGCRQRLRGWPSRRQGVALHRQALVKAHKLTCRDTTDPSRTVSSSKTGASTRPPRDWALLETALEGLLASVRPSRRCIPSRTFGRDRPFCDHPTPRTTPLASRVLVSRTLFPSSSPDPGPAMRIKPKQ